MIHLYNKNELFSICYFPGLSPNMFLFKEISFQLRQMENQSVLPAEKYTDRIYHYRILPLPRDTQGEYA